MPTTNAGNPTPINYATHMPPAYTPQASATPQTQSQTKPSAKPRGTAPRSSTLDKAWAALQGNAAADTKKASTSKFPRGPEGNLLPNAIHSLKTTKHSEVANMSLVSRDSVLRQHEQSRKQNEPQYPVPLVSREQAMQAQKDARKQSERQKMDAQANAFKIPLVSLDEAKRREQAKRNQSLRSQFDFD